MNFIRYIGDRHLFELLRGSFTALLFKVVGVVAGLLFNWFVANHYGAEGYGYFIVLWSVLMIAAVVGKIGFDTSIVKFIAAFYGKKWFRFVPVVYKKGLLFISLASLFVGAVIVLFAHDFSVLFFDKADVSSMFWMVAILVLPLVVLNYNAEALKGLKNITAFSAYQNSSVFLLSILVIWFMLNQKVQWNDIFYGTGISIALLLPLSFISLKAEFNRKLQNGNGQKQTVFPYSNREILKISLPMLYGNSLFLIMNWTDTLMLGAMGPENEVGIYNTALKISSLSASILIAVNSIAMPKYAELFERNDFSLFKNFVKQSSLVIFLVSLPLLLIILSFPESLLSIFGSEFIIGKTTLIILAAGQFFSAVSGSTIHLLNMTGRQKISQNILLVTTIINVLLNYFFIPLWGIEGAAIATCTTTVLWNLLAMFFIYKQFGFLTLPIHVKFRK